MPRKLDSEINPEKLAFWRARIEEQQSSGLSQSEFCRQNKLSPNAFSFWKTIIFPGQKLIRNRAKNPVRVKVFSPYKKRQMVKKWERSGLTQAEFCRKENILEWQLSDWKNQIKKDESQTGQQEIKFVEVDVIQERTKKAKTSFPQVTQGESRERNKGRVVAEIYFSGGSISILSDASMVDVRNILLALTECVRDRTQ